MVGERSQVLNHCVGDLVMQLVVTLHTSQITIQTTILFVEG